MFPVPSNILAFSRPIYRHGAVPLGRSFEVRGNPTAYVEGAHERSSASAKGHGIVLGKLPASGSAQDTAEHGQSGARGEDTGAEGIFEVPASACAADHFSNRLRVEGIDTSRLTQLGLLHWRAAIYGATAARAGIEHLFPTCPVVMPARRVALHGVDGALSRRAADDLGGALHALSENIAKALAADDHL